jgi:hypothetical protein
LIDWDIALLSNSQMENIFHDFEDENYRLDSTCTLKFYLAPLSNSQMENNFQDFVYENYWLTNTCILLYNKTIMDLLPVKYAVLLIQK